MNRIKEFRKRKKLSQSDISKIMKVKQNTISQWESDRTLPNAKYAIELAKILETTVEELYK